MIYIASPYTSPRPKIMNVRYWTASAYNAHLLKEGMMSYSPIAHCHPMAELYGLPRDINYWKKFNVTMLRKCDIMTVLCLDGWKNSKGLIYELEMAEKLHLDVQYLIPWSCRWFIEMKLSPEELQLLKG